jgi:hypothetical protein
MSNKGFTQQQDALVTAERMADRTSETFLVMTDLTLFYVVPTSIPEPVELSWIKTVEPHR